MVSEPTFPGKVVALTECFERAKIPYAFGGAIALAYYAPPRATSDIDLNVFIPPDEFGRVASALRPLGVNTEFKSEALERAGQCRLLWGQTPLDLFTANLPFHDAMARGIRRHPFGEATIRVLSPEHLIVCKALFDRVKDWPDIEQIVLTTPDLEEHEVTDWLTRMVGASDERTLRFIALTRT